MKKLTRPNPPDCLSHFRHGVHQWDDVSHEDKKSVWLKLNEMQDGFCAYCESSLIKKHIDHFRDKSGNPNLTFDWHNLFGSCQLVSRCGHYKDSSHVKQYSADELIKPDVDDPDEYLIFLTNGRVRVKNNLSDRMKKKASETIRVFNLDNDSALVGSRRSMLKSEINIITCLYTMQDDFSPDDFQVLLEDEITKLAGREYQTALRHAWLYNVGY